MPQQPDRLGELMSGNGLLGQQHGGLGSGGRRRCGDVAGVERWLRVVFDRELDGLGSCVTTDLPAFWSRACSNVDMPPGTTMTSGEGVSSNEWVAPMTRTPESAVIGPGSCQTKRISVSGRLRSTS
jgi:hypothetical protein